MRCRARSTAGSVRPLSRSRLSNASWMKRTRAAMPFALDAAVGQNSLARGVAAAFALERPTHLTNDASAGWTRYSRVRMASVDMTSLYAMVWCLVSDPLLEPELARRLGAPHG